MKIIGIHRDSAQIHESSNYASGEYYLCSIVGLLISIYVCDDFPDLEYDLCIDVKINRKLHIVNHVNVCIDVSEMLAQTIVNAGFPVAVESITLREGGGLTSSIKYYNP